MMPCHFPQTEVVFKAEILAVERGIRDLAVVEEGSRV